MNATTKPRAARRAKPGEIAGRALLERVLRVDHAGEFGAKRIYEGQLAVLGGSKSAAVIEHMAEQEREHLEVFEGMLVEQRVRPSMLHPFWSVAGFALGAGTALLGERAAMACTVAVEEVIDGHYARQLEQLGDDQAELREAIVKFRADELEHRDTALDHEAEQAPAYAVLSAAIKAGTRAAIWVAERV